MVSSKIRQSLYALGTVATGVLTLLSLWKLVDPATASTVSASLAALLGLFGAGAAGTAAVITGKQRNEGVFETDPAAQVAAGVKAVQAQIDAARAQADAVKAAISDVVDDVPVLGPLASEVLSKIRF
jgi:hypothetical protein